MSWSAPSLPARPKGQFHKGSKRSANTLRVLAASLHREAWLKGYGQRQPASLMGWVACRRAHPGDPAKPTSWRTADEPQTPCECPSIRSSIIFGWPTPDFTTSYSAIINVLLIRTYRPGQRTTRTMRPLSPSQDHIPTLGGGNCNRKGVSSLHMVTSGGLATSLRV